jgi:rhodanese-related sulfurtransferase/ABC-type amino acid transport substrate-binding protein
MNSKKKLALLLALLGSAGSACAQLTAVVAIEPTSRKDGLMVSRTALESSMGKALGQSVAVSSTDDLTDVMRATRSAGYDIFIAPAQVAASAINHGYLLVGSTEPAEQYVLVGKPEIGSPGEMRQRRIYLPQQDSIYTYMARGMLNASGLSFKDLRKVEYARYPQAGLTAMQLGLSDATVIRRSDFDSWIKEFPGQGKVLASSVAVPGGFSVAMRKDLAPDLREKALKWFASPGSQVGLKPVSTHAEAADYKAVAQLGTFTPKALPGAKVVTAAEVQQLVAQGALVVDTRNEKEYKARHIPNALFVPYHEKSLKDVAYESKLDDFAGLDKLDPEKPTVFHCNGAECWKSYKASRAAIARGFKQVYWFRGGMPEWEAAGMPTDPTRVATTK